MIGTFLRARRAAGVLLAILALAWVGCDSPAPDYRPPTASINGTPEQTTPIAADADATAPANESADPPITVPLEPVPLEPTPLETAPLEVPGDSPLDDPKATEPTAPTTEPAPNSNEGATTGEPSETAAPAEPAPLEVAATGEKLKSYEKPTGNHAPAGDANKAPFDPVRENGQVFEGWKKPMLALVITGRQDGYLEPCGCAGLENMKGGLSRRHSFLKELAARGWPVAAVDVGGMVRRFGKQAEYQFEMSANALREMKYAAVGFGPNDLRLATGDVLAYVSGNDPPEKSIFVSANVSLLGLTPKVRIVEVGGMKIGITSVLGKTYQKQVSNDEVQIEPAEKALKEVLSELKDCDLRVLLAQATQEESAELARKFPQFKLVITADGFDVPKAQPSKIEGTDSYLIEVGEKGMYAVVAGFYDDPQNPVRFQRVAFDARYPNSDAMKKLMVAYQGQLRQLGWQGLGLRAVAAPNARPNDKLAGVYVGAAKCQECHTDAYEVWANSGHAHATDTLVKLDPPRHFDAECISCHATGWNPQENYPYVSGFESIKKTPHLAANSCENCHGPGAAHVAAENGSDEARQTAERELLKLTWPAAKETTCVQCHDHDNSPEFKNQAEQYWEKVKH